MAQENTQGQAPTTTPPGELPVVGDKKLFTHTMQEDVARSKGDPSAFIKEMEAKKPFSQFIPPASPNQGGPAPMQNGGASADKFREAIDDIPQRDQPFPLPDTHMEPPVPQFQVRIPTQKSGLSTTTIILVIVLLLLIGGGAAGYWWFFMRTPQSEVVVQIPEKPAPAPQPIEPQPVPTPIPAPEPTPIPVEEPATTTPAVEPIATTTPPVVEPVIPPTPVTPPPPVTEAPVPTPAPEAAIMLDHTVTIVLSQVSKAEVIEKLAAENAKITDGTTTIRYVFALATPTGQTYLSSADVASMLGITVPQSIQSLAQRTDLVGYKNAGTVRYGLAAAITNKTTVKSAALAWEKTMLADLAGLYIEKMYEAPATTAFSTNTYLTFYKRYLNMPQPDTSLDWAASNTHFLVATSKDMIFALIAKAGQSKK